MLVVKIEGGGKGNSRFVVLRHLLRPPPFLKELLHNLRLINCLLQLDLQVYVVSKIT